ncbi:hypothetical protein ACFLQ3_00185, partial [Bacteroidota bacterium]
MSNSPFSFRLVYIPFTVSSKTPFSSLTFQPNQTNIALFSFNIPEGFSNRIQMLEFGVEVLEITYGLD